MYIIIITVLPRSFQRLDGVHNFISGRFSLSVNNDARKNIKNQFDI